MIKSLILSAALCSTWATNSSHGSIVDVAAATPGLSTLVAALKAGDLIDTLSGSGPFTVFAPTNAAFQKLPNGTLNRLLEPRNRHELQEVLKYHVAAGAVFAKDIKNRQQIKTVEGNSVTASLAVGRVFINKAEVTSADVKASNGVVHIIDSVLMPPPVPSPRPSPPPAPTPTPTPAHHTCTKAGCPFFWFSYYSSEGPVKCGEVDAAPRMPDDIWADPKAVDEYVAVTLALYAIGGRGQLKQGRCPRQGWRFTGTQTTTWTTRKLMEVACNERCNCRYPDCKDVPDDPKEHRYCSLCGPKFNARVKVKIYQRNK